MTAPKSPTRTQIRAAWQDLKRIYRTHLAQHNVKLPEDGTAKALWLGVLWACKNRPVHKAEMSAIVQRELGGPPVDQQVRHLKRDGWNIVPGKRGGINWPTLTSPARSTPIPKPAVKGN